MALGKQYFASDLVLPSSQSRQHVHVRTVIPESVAARHRKRPVCWRVGHLTPVIQRVRYEAAVTMNIGQEFLMKQEKHYVT